MLSTTDINNFFAALFPKGGAGYDDGSYRAGDENYSDSPYYIGGGLFQNRGAGPESRNETVDIGSVILQTAQNAWNAEAFLILTEQKTIDEVNPAFRDEVQARVDNPPPAVQKAVSDCSVRMQMNHLQQWYPES